MIDLLVFPNEVQKIPGQPYNGFSVTYISINLLEWGAPVTSLLHWVAYLQLMHIGGPASL